MASLAAPVSVSRPASRRLHVPRPVVVGAVVALAAAVVFTALPGAYNAISNGIAQIPHADAQWIAIALGLEALSFLGHIVLFRAVFVDGSARVGYGASYEITMAGHAATRVFGAAGAGGVALQVWALRRSGLPGRTVAARMVAFIVLLYSFYAVTVAVVGLGLWTGVLSGGGSPVLTVLPGVGAVVVIGGALLSSRLATRLRLTGKPAQAAATVSDGVEGAIEIVKARDPRLLGGVAWWAFDIAVLWAAFHAFGASPPIFVITLGYFLGLIGNALPFLGSLGGVDGGMIGALVALGTIAPVTIAAVVVYRLISCWQPTVPGLAAYLQLRRRMGGWDEAAPPAPAA
ncbi:MAG: YbhN family protein [Thermoleophilaceae bacterium]